MQRAVILVNGTPPEPELLHRVLERSSLFVCADGGAAIAQRNGVRPAAIIGDFDSISPETLAHFEGVPQVRDPDQNRTDTDKAILYVLARGPFDEITILGASTGRLDHVVGHLGLLRKFSGTRVVLQDDAARAYLVSGDVKLDCPPGTVVSFFAVGGPVERLTTENLRYPLHDVRMELGVQDSVSNIVDEPPAWIRFRHGTLLVIEAATP